MHPHLSLSIIIIITKSWTFVELWRYATHFTCTLSFILDMPGETFTTIGPLSV
jgi:hypothetical protein